MITIRPEIFLPIFLYAETHYKFKGIYSRLFKKEPEILADAPSRIEPGLPIPILLLIKDAHRFGIFLDSVKVDLTTGEQHTTGEYLFNKTINRERYWFQIIYVSPPETMKGFVSVNVTFKIKINDQLKVYQNDNYTISSHLPLQVFLANEPLPRFPNWFFGDFHYHSNYTEDMVEFGAPLAATVDMARAMGIHFFAVTDHSYDLDDREDDWLTNDPQIPKWFRMLDEVKRLNKSVRDFVILPGEEVSAGNSKGKNVHLLIINNNNFIEGKGDGAERWLQTKPDFSIIQILDRLEDEGLAIAGHPEMKVPLLQQLLIRRGHWQKKDFEHSKLHGFQIWNGDLDEAFYKGSQVWIKKLLQGKRLSLIAGNDAHGNFNRFKQIGFPFFTFREFQSQIFGQMRSSVHLTGELTLGNIIDAVKQGHALVTNGPIIEFHAINEDEKIVSIGDNIEGKRIKIIIRAKSSVEFGGLESIRFFVGDFAEKNEHQVNAVEDFKNDYFFEDSIQLPDRFGSGYLRAEVDAQKSTGEITKCLTNPIWFDRTKNNNI